MVNECPGFITPIALFSKEEKKALCKCWRPWMFDVRWAVYSNNSKRRLTAVMWNAGSCME